MTEMRERTLAGTQRLLFVDRDSEFWNSIHDGYIRTVAQVGAPMPQPVFADSLQDAQAHLVDPANSFLAIFVNLSLGEPIWQAVLRSAHRYCIGVPIYLTCDKPVRLRQSDAQQLGVSGVFLKPLSYTKARSAALGAVEEELLLEAAAPPAAPSEPDADSQDPTDYVEVKLQSLTGRHHSLFDLYVRLKSGRYVRVLLAGDALSTERLESYRGRGLETLCLLKSAQKKYLQYCDEVISNIIGDQRVNVESKLSSISTYGASTLSFLKRAGFRMETIDLAKRQVEHTSQIVEQIAKNNEHVRRLIDDVASLEHGVGTATLCTLFIRNIGGMSPSLLSTIGLAAFLHDVALVGEAPEIVSENESLMSPEQREVYAAHPDIGARILMRSQIVPPMVVSAIADHHLKKGGRGFPAERPLDEVNRLSELIGLSHDLLDGIRKSKSDRGFNPVEYLRKHAAADYSEPVVDAFIRTFEKF